MTRGSKNSGDLIPWVISQQFQDDDFPSLNGARVVRIATHPDYTGMGYGKRAVELVEQYYMGGCVALDEDEAVVEQEVTKIFDEDLENVTLFNDDVKVRDAASLPPLLLKLSERPLGPLERLHWLGVSFGLTQQLQKFWKRSGFIPLYIRQTQNEITGEHTIIMLKSLSTEPIPNQVTVSSPEWLNDFAWDFRRRFLELLSYQFKSFEPITVLSLLEAVGAKRSGNDELSSSRGLDSGIYILI